VSRRYASIALLALCGCGTRWSYLDDLIAPLPPPPSEQVRAQFGLIEVRLIAPEPELQIDAPARGTCRGSAVGLAGGWYFSMDQLSSPPQGSHHQKGWADLAALLALPVALAVGPIYGAIAAPSREDVDPVEHEILRAIREAQAPETLRRAVASESRERARRRTFPEDGPAVETRLEIGPVGVRLLAPWQVRSEPALLLTASARLVRTGSGTVLAEARVHHWGPTREFSAWAEDGGSPLAAAIREGIAALSEQIVTQFFVRYLLPEDRPVSGTSRP